MFPVSGQISLSDSLQYDSPGENHLTSDPTRVFPDLQQILDNNTDADTGACPTAPIAPPVPQAITECYAEFLPTAAYVGFAGQNASPLSLHFRFTARDQRGGTNSADTTVLLDSTAGPFLVTSPNTAVTYGGGSTQTVTWDKAGTDDAAISAANVTISLSTDGGHTFPTVLAASTPNDGTEAVTLPALATTQARIKIEAVGNVFFDVSNATSRSMAHPVVTAERQLRRCTTATRSRRTSPCGHPTRTRTARRSRQSRPAFRPGSRSCSARPRPTARCRAPAPGRSAVSHRLARGLPGHGRRHGRRR